MKKTIGMLNARLLGLTVVLILSVAPALMADNIVINTVVTSLPGSDVQFFGQSVTTPGGGPWNNIQFNFYQFSNGSAGSPSAYGTLFLLTQEYLGIPGTLSNATPGFLASTSNVAGGVWTFASGVTLAPNTQYFFLTNTAANPATIVALASTNPYAGGVVYRANSTVPNYETTLTGYDMAFRLQGTPPATTVPEPNTFLLLATGGLLLFGVRRAHRV